MRSLEGSDLIREHGSRSLMLNASAPTFFSSYLSNTELENQMIQIAARCGGIAHIVKWGVSGKGQDLIALELYAGTAPESDRPGFK